MPEITSFFSNVPTLQKKRPQQSSSVAQPQNKRFSPALTLSSHPADSVHFSGGKKRGSSDDAGSSQNNKKQYTFGAGGGKPSQKHMPEPDSDSESEYAPLFSMLFGGDPTGDRNPFNKPPIKPAEVMMKHIKPLDEDGDTEWQAYQEPAQPYADKLAEITSRAHMYHAVLHTDDEQMKKAILMRLKEKSPDKNFYSVDCAPGNLRKLAQHYKGPALPHIFAEHSDSLGLPTGKPTVLHLDNASAEDAESLQRREAFLRLKKQNSHFRFVITQPKAASEGGEHAGGFMKIMLGGLGGEKPMDTKPAPFAKLHVEPLNTQQWVQVLSKDSDLNKDSQLKQILQHYNLRFPQTKFKSFLDKLEKSQPGALDRDHILGEVDSLASFVRIQKHDDSPEVTDAHIAEYTKHLKPHSSKVIAEVAEPGELSSNPLEQKPYTLVKASDIKTRLDDVVGHDDVKKKLSLALEAIKYPALYEHLNKGDKDASNNNVLLMGEPGGGKSMLAEAIAGEGKGAFISTTGSQFVNVYVGMGANNMRQLKSAIQNAPDDLVVLFMDEIDSLGGRGGKNGLDGGGSREEAQTINEFLAMTEGVNRVKNKKLLLIGATNRPSVLDSAILDRFHYKETIGKLNGPQRKLLLEKQQKEKNLAVDKSVDLNALANKTEGLSGRDLRNIMKLAKQTLISQMPEPEKVRLEQDEKARKEFKLTLNQEVLEDALKQVKKGWEGVNGTHSNPDSLAHIYL